MVQSQIQKTIGNKSNKNLTEKFIHNPNSYENNNSITIKTVNCFNNNNFNNSINSELGKKIIFKKLILYLF